jgi:hypothetical protein
MVRAFPLPRVIAFLILLGLLPGCHTPSDQESSTKPVTTEGLPELGDYLHPLDQDRIEIAAPKGWQFAPRGDYIARIQKSPVSKYPSIIVTAEDYQGRGIDRVSEKNVEEFADQVAAARGKDRSEVQPVEIGSFVGVAYRKRGKEAGSVSRIVDMLFLDTVVSGRKYSTHLRSEQGSLAKDQPYLYAVVAGMKFREAESQPLPKEKPEEDKQPKSKAKKDSKEISKGKPKVQPKEKPKKDEKLELDLDKLLE